MGMGESCRKLDGSWKRLGSFLVGSFLVCYDFVVLDCWGCCLAFLLLGAFVLQERVCWWEFWLLLRVFFLLGVLCLPGRFFSVGMLFLLGFCFQFLFAVFFFVVSVFLSVLCWERVLLDAFFGFG